MIEEAIDFIASELNVHLQKIYALHQDSVVVSNLIDQNGSTPIQAVDKIAICLVNIEQETSIANLGFNVSQKGKSGQRNQPLNMNLNLLFASQYSNYNQSLRSISDVITFFHSNNSFTKETSKKFPKVLDKVVLEILKLDYQGTNYLWTSLGAKYVPSVIYKMRMIQFDSNVITKVGTLTNPEVTTTPSNLPLTNSKEIHN